MVLSAVRLLCSSSAFDISNMVPRSRYRPIVSAHTDERKGVKSRRSCSSFFSFFSPLVYLSTCEITSTHTHTPKKKKSNCTFRLTRAFSLLNLLNVSLFEIVARGWRLASVKSCFFFFLFFIVIFNPALFSYQSQRVENPLLSL